MKLKSSLLVLSLLSLPLFAADVQNPEPGAHSWSFTDIGMTPIQTGGRIKPLDTFAREVILFNTGKRNFKGWQPVDLVFSWITHPNFWEKQPIIRIGREDVRRQIGLDETKTHFSPAELFHNSTFLQYADRVQGQSQTQTQAPAGKQDPRDQEMKLVVQRLSLFQGVVTGQSWGLIPRPAPNSWKSVVDEGTTPVEKLISKEFSYAVKSYLEEDRTGFEEKAKALRTTIEGLVPGFEKQFKKAVLAEFWYNQIRPFFWACIFYFTAAVLFGVSIKLPKPTRLVAHAAITLAILGHVAGMILRCFIAGRPPVTNMYESVVWVSFGVVFFSVVLYRFYKQVSVLTISSGLAALGLLAADSAPAVLDPLIHPLVPVLRSNYWLTIHVLTITLGYAAFALSMGLANVALFHFAKHSPVKKIQSLNQMTYRAIQIGVVLIAAGTILGGIWADYSWGRFWGWDPKEVWALITLLAYLVILHGRYTQWMSSFRFTSWTALCFMTVVMAWYGVNFILGVGLHSYGFSTGGQFWVFTFVAVQLLYIGAVYAQTQMQRRARS